MLIMEIFSVCSIMDMTKGIDRDLTNGPIDKVDMFVIMQNIKHCCYLPVLPNRSFRNLICSNVWKEFPPSCSLNG
jgi:hypothetical protein